MYALCGYVDVCGVAFRTRMNDTLVHDEREIPRLAIVRPKARNIPPPEREKSALSKMQKPSRVAEDRKRAKAAPSRWTMKARFLQEPLR